MATDKNSSAKKFRYNQLKYARLKSACVGMIAVLQGVSLIYYFNILQFNIFLFCVLSLLPLLTVFLFTYVPFGQVLEPIDQSRFKTYTEFGHLKWNLKPFDSVTNIKIEQDENRYYGIITTHSEGKDFFLERYATLGKAGERIAQLRLACK